jgi:hypothetical protein
MRRPWTVLAFAACVLASTIVAAPTLAWAHTPVLEKAAASDAPWKALEGVGPAWLFPGAQDLPDPRISRALYGTLAEGEQFDAYRFQGPSDETAPAVTIPVQLLVPASPGNAALRPTIVIVGFGESSATAGLPPSVVEHLRSVQATVPLTVAVDPGADPRGSEYEPFVAETLWQGASTKMAVEAGKTYYVIVFDPAGATGEYRLALGEAERFTLGEALATPVDILRIKLGLYGQDAFNWGFAAILAGVTGAVAVLAWWLARRRRARRAGG